MTYKGSVADWWFNLSILMGIAIPLAATLPSQQYWLLATPAVFALFMLIWGCPQVYKTTEDALRIRSGLANCSITWSAITSVNVASDSCNSPGRVLIRHTGGKSVVAMDNQALFIDDIANHCPQLSRRGMDLIAVSS